MLEKIESSSTILKLKYDHRSGQHGRENYSESEDHQNKEAGDSSDLSAASLIISDLDWNLLYYEYEKESKFSIKFEFKEIEFHFETDVHSLSNNLNINLVVIKKIKSDDKFFKVFIKFGLTIKEINFADYTKNISFIVLNKLIERIMDAHKNIQLEKDLYQVLLADSESKLISELKVILSGLFLIMAKMQNLNKPTGLEYSNVGNEMIKIENLIII